VLQQCVTFNKVNTFGWYKERVQKLPDDYDPTDRQAAFSKALEWGDHIPIGVLYVHERPAPSAAGQTGTLEELDNRHGIVRRVAGRNGIGTLACRSSNASW